MTRFTDLLKKIPGPVLAVVAFVAVFTIMGQSGYRAGNVVRAPGGFALDPEWVRAIAALIAAALAGGATKLPYVDAIRGLLKQLGFVGGLSVDEEREQLLRIRWQTRDMPADWKPDVPPTS